MEFDPKTRGEHFEKSSCGAPKGRDMTAQGVSPGSAQTRITPRTGGTSVRGMSCPFHSSHASKRFATLNHLLAVAVILLGTSICALSQAMSKGIMSPPANVRPPGLKNVAIEQRLNEQIPPQLVFRDETGKTVRLEDYFGKRPMILNLVYYQCPMLCGEVLSGLES